MEKSPINARETAVAVMCDKKALPLYVGEGRRGKLGPAKKLPATACAGLRDSS